MHDDKTRKADNKRGMLRFMSECLHPEPTAQCAANDCCNPQPSFTYTPRMLLCSLLIYSHPAEQQDIGNQQIQTNEQLHIPTPFYTKSRYQRIAAFWLISMRLLL